MKNEILLRLPLVTSNLICARLTAGAVAGILGIDIETAEDIKVCVNESCLILMSGKFQIAEIKYFIEDNLRIEIEGAGICEECVDVRSSDFDISKLLLNSLIDEVEFIEDGTRIIKIILQKRK